MKFSRILLCSVLIISGAQLFAAEGEYSPKDLVRSAYGVDPDTLERSVDYIMRLQALNDADNSTSDQFKSELNKLSAVLFLEVFEGSGEPVVWSAYEGLLNRLRNHANDQAANRAVLQTILDAVIASALVSAE